MSRKINLEQADENSADSKPDAVEAVNKVFLDATRRTLEQERIMLEIEELRALRAKIGSDSKSRGLRLTARRAMLGLAALLSVGAIGDAAVPDEPEYMETASAIELLLFHNETDPIELLGLTIPLLGGAAYTRRRREDDDDED